MAISYIDAEACIGCGVCVESCPMDVFRLNTSPAGGEASPCSLACPLGVDQRTSHHLLRSDRIEEAAEAMRLSHPMPAITGRLCPHPCEDDCTRLQIDAAVNINALEQVVGDKVLEEGPAPHAPATSGGRVAVVGSGPAGLAAAYFLVLEGHAVTVFEKDEEPGGLLRTAVPTFRLPEEVLDAQIAYYERMGIAFRCGTRIGAGLTVNDLRREGFDAFVAATGASAAVEMIVPGADAEGVVGAMDFLTAVRRGEVTEVTGEVVVVGGGSVALDAARTSLRLGADSVGVVCLEVLEAGLKDSMPALSEEIDDAIAEGVAIHPSKGVGSFVVEGGRVRAVKCVECLSVRDEHGVFSPRYADCELPLEIPAGLVIVAVGQTADPQFVPEAFAVDGNGFIVADAETRESGPGLYAAGDATSGPATVVEALAAGKRAAAAASRYLAGDRPYPVDEARAPAPALPDLRRQARARDRLTAGLRTERVEVAPELRAAGFADIVRPLSSWSARDEADRCLTCGCRSTIAYLDDCQTCRLCQLFCPTGAIAVSEGVLLGQLNTWDVISLQDGVREPLSDEGGRR